MNELSTRPMSFTEARACADQINANLTNIRALVLALYEREGWQSLGYKSWRECVTAEFRQNERYLYRQLEAAQMAKQIWPLGQKEEIPERQLRPLTKLKDNPDQQRAAWQQAVATAPNGRVTAAIVCNVVKSIMVGQEKPSPAPQPQMPPDAIKFVENAIGQLERILPCDPRREAGLGKLKQWLKDNTAQSKPKIRAGKGKIPKIRRKPVWSSNNQMPFELTPAGDEMDRKISE